MYIYDCTALAKFKTGILKIC